MRHNFLFTVFIFASIHLFSQNHYSQSYFNNGLDFYKKENYQEAVRFFTVAITSTPDYYEAYLYRGGANMNLGDLDLAINDFNKAIEIQPDSAVPYYSRGQVNRYKEN
ncbi:MAG: tetratricopeptide repeat protein [Bacteroidetes bacterium]|nr:tetratricopeptide repeat protein [Bacteroidota bacterium]